MIFLAVKPAIVKDVIEQLAKIEGLLERALIVSFAASVSIEHIERYANKELSVIRTMPSTPILIGEGVISVSKNDRVDAKDFQFFCRMMSSIAHVEVINEELMNPIISVHGSSPAYVYLFIKSMLDAAEEQGIDRKIALPLILKTIKGSVTMVEKCNESIETLIGNVASPNGTTLAALNSFENDGFSQIISRAMDACTKRANEITNEL
jgi:pyrroline-5-carboxylate reductase